MNKGFATLPTILAISAMILIVAFGIAVATFTETTSGAADLQSAASLRFAEAGANDALIRIARDKNYQCTLVDCYSLDMAANGCANSSACAKVSVSAGVGTIADPKIITASGIVQNKTRKMQVQVVYDSLGYGRASSTVWQELTN
jgi:hypothetical protein